MDTFSYDLTERKRDDLLNCQTIRNISYEGDANDVFDVIDVAKLDGVMADGPRILFRDATRHLMGTSRSHVADFNHVSNLAESR